MPPVFILAAYLICAPYIICVHYVWMTIRSRLEYSLVPCPMVDDDLALGTGSGKSSVHEIRIEGKRDILGKEKVY